MDWGTAQDAPIRTIDKISAFINNDYEEKQSEAIDEPTPKVRPKI